MENENLSIQEIDELIDYAWSKALKYRYDPISSRIHEEYLQLIKSIKEKNINNKK